ncbi:MAG: hypothetical protein HZB44_00605 [Actinobacteria bacterium]|nr:hypothetical protein [Actinomycetota bacterium]
MTITIANSGDGEASSVILESYDSTGGTLVLTPTPMSFAGAIPVAGEASASVAFFVPPGVSMFNSRFFFTAGDSCGSTHRFPPGPWPGEPSETGCPAFPEDNIWNTRVDGLPLDANSDLYVQTIGTDENFHADFGSGLWDGGPIGIPFIEVDGSQPLVPISFEYADESDPGPYPIPPDAPIEGGSGGSGDRHILLIDTDDCHLYEIYHAFPQPDGSWQAGSGAVFDLRSNALRPDGWTSADAAGLPIYPGLVKYEEVASGEIRHAIRFTAPQTRQEYIWPARHYASYLTDIEYPPMGQRFRLKADYDITPFSSEVQVILTAMKRYGIILADNGAPWYITGAPDERWDNDNLHELHLLRGSDFEAVDESDLMVHPDSAQAAGS